MERHNPIAMKTFNLIQHPICCCPNQSLLLEGHICDICMGKVAGNVESLAIEAKSRFDDRYFESLERCYDDVEFAA